MNIDAFLPAAERFFLWNTQVSFEAAILVLLLLLIQRLFHKQISASWRYALWLLVACRLLAPTIPASATSIFNWVDWNLPQSSKTILVTPKVVPIEATLPRAAGEPIPVLPQASPVQTVLLLVWAAGALLLLLNLLVQHLKFSRLVAHQRQLTNPDILSLLEDCRMEMKITAPVVIIAADNISSPALFGCIRPRILIPAKIVDSLNLAELRFVLLHELAHIKRCDIPVNWLITFLQIVHWYNPFLWWAFARMRADRELACDAAVLQNTGETNARAYGNTILKLIETYSKPITIPGTTGIMEEKTEMQNRIRMIASFRDRKSIPFAGAVLFAVLALSGLTGKSGTSGVSVPERYLVTNPHPDSESNIGNEPAELFFGGKGDVFALGNELGNFGTNDFTIEFWIQTFPGKARYIMGKRFICNNDSFWDCGLKGTGEVCFEISNDTSGENFHRVDGTIRVDDQNYHHIAITRAGRRISQYIDGVEDGTLETPFLFNITNPAHLTLGKTVCTLVDGSPYFAGQLKNISIYNVALPAETIRSLSQSSE